jgi:GT2 family glycosyltransferase
MNIAIVVICYNSQSFLEKNLNSLISQSIPFNEIIVIDNNSSDKSCETIRKYQAVNLINSRKNLGYSKAANLGIKNSNSEIIIIANPDIILTKDFNSRVLRAFEEDKHLGMISPLLLRFDKKTIDSAGQDASLFRYPKEYGYNRPLARYKLKNREIFSVCGAVTIFRRNILEKLKLEKEYYDEDFFLFWEDFDLGWRADLYNIKKIFIGDLVAYHYRSGSLKDSFLKKISLSIARPGRIKFHLVKNRYLTLIKNFRLARDWYSIPFILFKDVIWVLTLTLFSPKIIINLIQSRNVFVRAFKKRRLIKKNE